MAEEVKPDTFHPPHHKLKSSIELKLDVLLKEYASQFAKDETSIGTTPLAEMTIDMGTSHPVEGWNSLEQYIGFEVRLAFNYYCSLHQV